MIKPVFSIILCAMGYVFDFQDAKQYLKWCNDSREGFSARMQNRLMLDMLAPVRGEAILEIGCGTGLSLRPFVDMGLDVTGIDPSPYMLDIAANHLGQRAALHRGVAEDLPFDDNAFHYACLITTLEFVEDPARALAEACRVAKDKIFVGVLNRYAIKGIQRRVQGVFTETIYNRARFFSVWEIRQMMAAIVGDVPIAWRTVCHLSETPGRFLRTVEKSSIVQRCPFGAFAGISACLVPRFRTKPLPLKYAAKQTVKPAAG